MSEIHCNTSQPNLVVQVLVIRATRPIRSNCCVVRVFSFIETSVDLLQNKVIPKSHLGREIFLFSFEGARLIIPLVELLAKSQVGVTHQLTDE